MEAPVKQNQRRGKRAYIILGAIAVIVAVLWGVHRLWTRGKQSTDDAQIEADVVPISSRVSGTILATRVHDNRGI